MKNDEFIIYFLEDYISYNKIQELERDCKKSTFSSSLVIKLNIDFWIKKLKVIKELQM